MALKPVSAALAALAVLLIAGAGAASAAPAKPAQASAAAPRITVEDYIEIQQLYARYAHALDKGEGEQFAATFVQDGEFTGGRAAGHGGDVRNPTKGADALYRMGSRGGTRHFTANLVITPTAEGAKGSCYLLLYSARSIPPSFVETAIYDDTLVKTARGWKFKKRVVWRDDDDITPFKPKPLPDAPGR